MKILLCILMSFSLALANIEDYRVSTWNLQGSLANTESKWNVSVRQLITGDNPANILMVQEAGAIPATARRTGRMVQPGGTPIEEFIWELGTYSRPNSVYIYYAPLDVGARRVNLAIVSDRRADEVIVVHQNVVATEASRPAIGIRIGNDVFFNIHALASGGSDSAALVTAVHDYFINMPQINWLIAGDFNRDPALLQSGLDTRITNHIRIVAPNAATHFGARGTSRTLDYAVVGRSSATRSTTSLPQITALLIAASIRAHLSSDHFPVHFGRF